MGFGIVVENFLRTLGPTMAKNPIQFQSGLSLTKFLEHYGTEQQCRDALFRLRWPEGFVCPECGNGTYCVITRSKRFQCNRCHHQTSLTAGTVFERTRTPLRVWFLAIYLITQRKQGISTLQLSRAGHGVRSCFLPRPFGERSG